MDILMTEVLGNLVWHWAMAVGIVLAIAGLLRLTLWQLVRRLHAVAVKTPTQLDDLIVELLDKTKSLFIVIISIYFGSLVLDLPDAAYSAVRSVLIVVLLLQIGYWGNALVGYWIRRSVQKKLTEDAATATTMSALGFVTKIVIWSVVLLAALDTFMDVTAIIAGVGIGGIAIALAVQNILSDLFASVSIIVDKPFVIGDFIIVGDQLGTVERIGLKTTRVRSLTGEQIIFSNSDLLSSRVRNFKRMFERRIVFSVGVTYQTSHEAVQEIPGLIREIVEETPETRFDRSHFKAFGDFALLFETVFYVLKPDFNTYMDAQQTINLGIMQAFAERGIEFAYPTQTLYVQRETLEDE